MWATMDDEIKVVQILLFVCSLFFFLFLSLSLVPFYVTSFFRAETSGGAKNQVRRTAGVIEVVVEGFANFSSRRLGKPVKIRKGIMRLPLQLGIM